MNTLKAGSYLALMKDPIMDLMDVVGETVPSLKEKERHKHRDMAVTLKATPRRPGEEAVEKTYTLPLYHQDERIAYECTHGLRFANCNQWSKVFLTEPVSLGSSQAPHGVHAWNGSIVYDEGTLHTCRRAVVDGRSDNHNSWGYGLVSWDLAIESENEIYPGYPGEPQHLPLQEEPLDVDDVLVRAFDSIRPAVTSDMSLLVTLAELKDVKSLITEPLHFGQELVQLLGRRKARSLKVFDILADVDLLKFLAKNSAKAHLYSEFGYKQTRRDLMSMVTVICSVDRYVREVLSLTGPNTRHYSLPIYKSDSEVVNEWRDQDKNWAIYKHWASSLSRKFVCTVQYETELVDAMGRPISRSDPELVKLGASLDKLGLNMDPSILWDLVPFSFVVDYFLNIGDWLGRFKRMNLNPTFDVKDSCYSVKTERITEGITHRYNRHQDAETRGLLAPQGIERFIGGLHFKLSEKTYNRVRFLPTRRMLTGQFGPLEPTMPRDGQLGILVSLLTANLPALGRK